MARSEPFLPCPFCGENPQPDWARIKEKSWHWLRCTGPRCGTNPSTPQYLTLDQAIAAWNTRAAIAKAEGR